MDEKRKICPVCGVEFEGRGNQKYCSYECRQKATTERQKPYRKDYYKKNSDKVKSYQAERRNKNVKPVSSEKVCPICGKPFISEDGRQKYCSVDCRKEAEKLSVQKSNAAKKVMHSKVCPVCGNQFFATNGNKVYCSDECKKEAILSKERKRAEDPNYRRQHSERTIKYQQKVKELGMTVKELKEFEHNGGDIELYLEERIKQHTLICPACQKEFITYDKRIKYCPECSKIRNIR